MTRIVCRIDELLDAAMEQAWPLIGILVALFLVAEVLRVLV